MRLFQQAARAASQGLLTAGLLFDKEQAVAQHHTGREVGGYKGRHDGNGHQRERKEAEGVGVKAQVQSVSKRTAQPAGGIGVGRDNDRGALSEHEAGTPGTAGC